MEKSEPSAKRLQRPMDIERNARPGMNGELEETFRRCYPRFRLEVPLVLKAAA